MTPEKNKPFIRPQPAWQNRCYRVAVAGPVVWLAAVAGVLYAGGSERPGYMLLLGPVVYLITALEFLVCVLTAFTWHRWPDKQRRTLTLCCSGAVVGCFFVLMTVRFM